MKNIAQSSLMPTWQLRGSRAAALGELESRVEAALATYSNVHRGAGFYSEVTTALYERARAIVSRHFGVSGGKHTVIFTSPHGSQKLGGQLGPRCIDLLSSHDLGLPLGVRALCVETRALPSGSPVQSGGGTARHVSPDSAIWSGAPERFEPGTPAVLNVIALALALQMVQRHGAPVFAPDDEPEESVEAIFYRDAWSELEGLELKRALKRSLVGGNSTVPTIAGRRSYVNLDNAASMSSFEAVWQTVCRTWRQPPSARRKIVQEVRRICSAFLDAPTDEYGVVFVANTTEAMNAVAACATRIDAGSCKPVVVNTWLEHNSNELPWRGTDSLATERVSIDAEGFVDLGELERLLRAYNLEGKHEGQRVVLVSVSGASNVLGTYNDLERICAIAHRYGARVLVDAAQLIAHRAISMQRSGVDYLAFSGHKAYAPFGSGALVARKSILQEDSMTWEAINASGEENLIGVAALGKALHLLGRIGMELVETEERHLTRRVLDGLRAFSDARVYGIAADSPKLVDRGGIVAFSVKSVPHNRVAEELALRGAIGVRTGCHCAHLLIKHLLEIPCFRARMADFGLLLLPSFTQSVLPGLVHVSLGVYSDASDVERFLETLAEILEAPRTPIERALASKNNGTPFASVAPMREVREAVCNLVDTVVAAVFATDERHSAEASHGALPLVASFSPGHLE